MNVKKVFLWSFGLLFTLGILGCAAVAGLFYWASRDLPDLERLTGYEAPQATVILARDGSTIGTLATEKRYSITLKEMSPWLPMSFLAAEDDSFYQHHGVDPVAIVRAFIYNLRNKGTNPAEGEDNFGIVRRDFTPKPAFRALERLIKREWHTETVLEYRAGADNRFHGFYGKYDAEIETEYGRVCREFDLSRFSGNEFNLMIK